MSHPVLKSFFQHKSSLNTNYCLKYIMWNTICITKVFLFKEISWLRWNDETKARFDYCVWREWKVGHIIYESAYNWWKWAIGSQKSSRLETKVKIKWSFCVFISIIATRVQIHLVIIEKLSMKVLRGTNKVHLKIQMPITRIYYTCHMSPLQFGPRFSLYIIIVSSVTDTRFFVTSYTDLVHLWSSAQIHLYSRLPLKSS